MSNAVFPTNLTGLGWDFVKIPRWSTIVQWSVTRRRTAVGLMQYPVYDYSVVFDVLRTTAAYLEYQTMLGFFNARQGAYDTFLIDDPDDDLVTAQAIGTGDGSTLTFQMVRTLGSFVQPVYDVKNSPTPLIYLNGVLQSSFYSITSAGVLTFTGGHAPGNGVAITATFGYYWRVTFKDDQMNFAKFMQYRYRLDQVDLLGVAP